MEHTQTFHPFPRLPAELRLMIWHFTATVPRIVAKFDTDSWKCRSCYYAFTLSIPGRVPAPLHACVEAREALTKGAHPIYQKVHAHYCMCQPIDPHLLTFGTRLSSVPIMYAMDKICRDRCLSRHICAEHGSQHMARHERYIWINREIDTTLTLVGSGEEYLCRIPLTQVQELPTKLRVDWGTRNIPSPLNLSQFTRLEEVELICDDMGFVQKMNKFLGGFFDGDGSFPNHLDIWIVDKADERKRVKWEVYEEWRIKKRTEELEEQRRLGGQQ